MMGSGIKTLKGGTILADSKHITITIGECKNLKLYADTRLSMDEIINHLNESISMMENKPSSAYLYTKGSNPKSE